MPLIRRLAGVSLFAIAIVPIARDRATQARYCIDQVETKAFACSVGTANRTGDSLVIKLRDSTLVFGEVSKGDIQRHYKYLGRVGVDGFHLVTARYYEGPWESLIINPRDGKVTAVEWDAVPSPDSRRFVVATDYWGDCEGDEQGLEVYRFEKEAPVREWQFKPYVCGPGGALGWGAVSAKWRGADTLEFIRSEPGVNAAGHFEGRKTPMVAVRDSAGWHVQGTPGQLLRNPPPATPYVGDEACAHTCPKVTIACRDFKSRSSIRIVDPDLHQVSRGDEVRVLNSVLVVNQPGKIVARGLLRLGNDSALAGDTIYTLESLGGRSWRLWYQGRDAVRNIPWLDSTGRISTGTLATRVSPLVATRWTMILRIPTHGESSGWTYIVNTPGLLGTDQAPCRP